MVRLHLYVCAVCACAMFASAAPASQAHEEALVVSSPIVTKQSTDRYGKVRFVNHCGGINVTLKQFASYCGETKSDFDDKLPMALNFGEASPELNVHYRNGPGSCFYQYWDVGVDLGGEIGDMLVGGSTPLSPGRKSCTMSSNDEGKTSDITLTCRSPSEFTSSGLGTIGVRWGFSDSCWWGQYD